MHSSIDPRPTLAAPDEDPWIWLEEVEGERALRWVTEQNAATLARLADARYEADREAVKAVLDRPGKLPFITRLGGMVYNFWQDAANPRGIWRRATLDSYRRPAPEWEVLLDLDALASAEGADWVFHGGVTHPGHHDRAILHLSRGGGDAHVLREYDIPGRGFVEGGFDLPEAKGSAVWLDGDTLLLSSAWGEGMATTAGYARTVRLWQRGADPATAPVIFASDAAAMGVGVQVDHEVPGRLIFIDRQSFYEAVIHVGDRNGPHQRVELPPDAEFTWQRGWLAVRPRSPWTVGGITHPPDTLLGTRLDAVLSGKADYRVLFSSSERRALQGFYWCAGRLVVSVLDELRPVFLILGPGEADWHSAELQGLPRNGVASVWPLDGWREESDGTLLAQAQDPITPVRLMLTDTGLSTPVLLKESSRTFNATGMVVTRHEAISVDGARIPYTQTGPANAGDGSAPDGDAPVYMTGYGGFRVPSLPAYQAIQGKLWLERGGTTVVANIRGGGEFGTPWHEAGRRERKHLSHDDFAAVAADLVRRGVTRPGRIAAEGGSNGGLLIANMLTRYPEQFGALFCTIPLIDMRRYSRLLAGASWIAEYGDPDDRADWSFMRHFSAYHVAEPERPYPPILLATTRRDDRVHPGHARKMAAKLQGLGYPALFYEPPAGGHGYGKDNGEIASFSALGSAFLRRAIGWEVA